MNFFLRRGAPLRYVTLEWPLCNGEAGHFSLRCTVTFVIFSVAPVVGLFSPFVFLLCFS